LARECAGIEKRIKRAVLLTQGPRVTPADLNLDAPSSKYLAQGTGLREPAKPLRKTSFNAPLPSMAAT
jgi:hypothetical protein